MCLPPPTPNNYSSRKQRRTPKEWEKGIRTDRFRIDREKSPEADKQTLPIEAELRGHEDVVVQDVVLGTVNVFFHKEKYYSAAQCRTYVAASPAGYEGQLGPGMRALMIVLDFGTNASEPKLLRVYPSVGIVMSDHADGLCRAKPAGRKPSPAGKLPSSLHRACG